MYVTAIVRLTELVLIPADSALPLPKMFCWEIDALKTNFSELEYPIPASRLPVAFSTTVTSTSAWSFVPATGGVSMLTSSK